MYQKYNSATKLKSGSHDHDRAPFRRFVIIRLTLDIATCIYKHSSVDEIANVNVFCDNIVHIEASAYAH